MSSGLADMGFKSIDLDIGCPVTSITKKGKGSGLILRPERAVEIIQATKASGPPANVKTHLGYYNMEE